MKEDIGFPSLHEMTKKAIESVVKKRNDAILEKLKDHGYVFDNRPDFEHFLKTRCVIERYPNKLNVLRADGKHIVDWYDTQRIEHKVEDNGAHVFTCVIGEAPVDKKTMK